MTTANLVDQLTQKASLVSAVVLPVASMDEAMAYVTDVCVGKQACQILASGCDAPLSGTAEALCQTKQEKIICATEMPAEAVSPVSARMRPLISRATSVAELACETSRNASSSDKGSTSSV